jgi:uncharacterized membrane protein YeaQ/YmgE (transglycosylase-associated protein family)
MAGLLWITLIGGLLWITLIGFVAGTIARLFMPGPNTPKGFVLTMATFVGNAAGWYRPHYFAGFVSVAVGAIVILFIWHWLVTWRIIPDHGI